MFKKMFTYLLFFLFIIGCKDNSQSFKNKYILEPGNDSIIIPLDKNSRNLSYHIQYFIDEKTDFLALLNLNSNSIEIYNLNDRKLFKVIKIQKEGSNSFGEMTSFLIKDFDSILVMSTLPRRIGIVDTSGNIIKKIPFNQDVENRNIQTTHPWSGHRPYLKDNLLFITEEYYARESNGKLTETGQKRAFVGVTLDILTGICKTLPLTYPEDLIGKDVFIMTMNRVLGYNNKFVYHFGFLNNLFVTEDHNTFNVLPLESNYYLKFAEEAESGLQKGVADMYVHDEVQDILYDKYREQYYIIIRKRNELSTGKLNPNPSLLFPDCFIIILDKDLHHIGEVDFPINTYSFKMVFITEEGLYISTDNVKNPNFNEDYMRFELFKVSKI